METEWRIARTRLRELLQDNSQASHRELAEATGYSVSWVRKWRKRLAQAPPGAEQVLNGQSHRPHPMPRQVAVEVEDQIIALRVALSEQYHRTVGPRTIAAYLKRQAAEGKASGPRSSATIWRMLRKRQYILDPVRHDPQPVERPEPGVHWEVDFCTAAQVSPEAPQKRQHGLEVFNVVDRGSSACIDTPPSAQFDAEQALLSMAAVLQHHGVPRCVSYDRDPRLVGSAATDGCPSAFTRFLLCVGCAADILPPRRPDLKPFVERFQRTLQEACLHQHQPTTSAEAQPCLATYRQGYNQERPHQGKDLHDQPPAYRTAHSARLPRLPEQVNPDAWLAFYDKRAYRRHVDSSGTIQLWKYSYSIGLAFANQTVLVRLDAPQRQIHSAVNKSRLKTIPLKGLVGRLVDFQDFLGLMSDEARSEWKDYLWRHSLKGTPKAS
jgi:hypothetical protein